MRCATCWSNLESWELHKGRCPYCHPRQIVRTRPLSDEERQAYIDAGCPDCHIPYDLKMGVHFCKSCGLQPPVAVRFL